MACERTKLRLLHNIRIYIWTAKWHQELLLLQYNTVQSDESENRRFGETCRFNIQSQRVDEAESHHEAKLCLLPTSCLFMDSLYLAELCLLPASCWFLAWCTLRQWWERGGIQSFETSVDFHRTTRRYNPEIRILYSHRRENIKCNIGCNTVILTESFLTETHHVEWLYHLCYT
jgi:hypothetical protein